MVDDFTKLVCGVPGSSGAFAEIATHLKASLKGVVSEIIRLPTESPERIALFGPFLGRSVLELTYTALIGRLDPFRLLVLREIQMRLPTSDITVMGERCLTAIQWSGDIRPMQEGANPELWSPLKAMDKIPRSLLGKYYEHIFWIPAFTCVLDSLSDERKGDWFDELRTIEPEKFISRLRGECDRTYSSLSKGIHHEFVIPPETFYSPETVFEILKDAFRLTSHSALVSHAVPTCQFSIPLKEATALYVAVQSIENTLCLPTS